MGQNRALVTGACGFVGSHMVEYLVHRDWEVVATDLEEARRDTYYARGAGGGTAEQPEHKYYGHLLADLGVRFEAADLTDQASLEPLFERTYDVVFHTASLYDYFAEWGPLYEVNVRGGKNIGELAAENDAGHFVHWSTLGVCGGSETNLDEPVDERAEYDPHNRYGHSKQKQEEALIELQNEEGLPLTVLRPAPIYGPRHSYGVYHLLLLYRKVGTGLVFPIYPRRYQLRFPSVHVTDVVRAAHFVTQNRDRTVGEIYHVTSDPILQDELVTNISKFLGLPQHRIPLPWHVYRTTAKALVKLAEVLEKRARQRDLEPKFPASMARYLSSDFWYTNQKLKDEGFEFVYADPRKGLWEYVAWGKERGLL